MNWLDVGLIALVLVSVASGLRQGFSRSGFGFLAVIVAFLAAAWLSPASVKWFVVVFVGLICAGGIGACLLGRLLRTSGLEWLDRLLGGAFGLTNAVLLSVIAVLALMAFAPKLTAKYVARSEFAPYAVEAARTVAQVVPDEMKDRVEDTYAELVQVLPPKFRKPIPRLHREREI